MLGTKHFANDIQAFSKTIKNIRLSAKKEIGHYFENKILKKKIKLFSDDSVELVNVFFEAENNKDFIMLLSSANISINLPDEKNEKNAYKLMLKLDTKTNSINIISDYLDLIPTEQRKYIKELEYALTIAYRLTLLAETVEAIKNKFSNLFNIYDIIFSDSYSYDNLITEKSNLENFLKSKHNFSCLKQWQTELETLLIKNPSSIEQLLYDAYNSHTQGKGIYQRAWQTQVILSIAKEIDPECYKNNTSLYNIWYPILTFPDLENNTNVRSANKIQNGIHALLCYLEKNRIIEMDDEIRQYAHAIVEKIATIDRTIAPELLKKIIIIQATLNISYKKLQQINQAKLTTNITLLHYQLAEHLIKLLLAAIKFNKFSEIMKHIDNLDKLNLYVAAITETVLSQKIEYTLKNLDNTQEILALLKTFKSCNQNLFPEPNLLDKILAFFYEIIGLFEAQFRKCQKSYLMVQTENDLNAINKLRLTREI